VTDVRVRTIDPGPGARRFEVTVTGVGSTTVHEVTLSDHDLERLGPRFDSAEDLVCASFEFLLARESNEQILRSFDLPVIARYFPEFDDEITRPH
jgi:hypothetical protein